MKEDRVKLHEIQNIVRLIKKVNCSSYATIAESAKEVGMKKTAVMAAYLNSNAKVVSYGQAMRDLKKATGGNSKLSNALLNMGNPNAAVSIMALRNGYNVIDNGRGYYVVLDRSAVTVNSKVTAK